MLVYKLVNQNLKPKKREASFTPFMVYEKNITTYRVDNSDQYAKHVISFIQKDETQIVLTLGDT